MNQPTLIYATDEDVAVRSSADFSLLCPRDQKRAWGADGQFAAEDRWVLSSPSVDFAAYGVAPGDVVLLTQPAAVFKSPGELLVADSVDASGVRLRRKGQASGVGSPPGPPAGVAQVEFAVPTLGPQIARACEELNRRYGVDDLVVGLRPSDLFDPREVREATVLTVLYHQYLDMSRGSSAGNDAFLAKAQLYKQELDDLLSRIAVHWESIPGGKAGVTAYRFGTRLSR